MAGPSTERVTRRLVLYVHGFDPRGPGPYHAMQQEDAVRESARPDRTIAVTPRRRRKGEVVWTLNAIWPEGAVETEFVFLRWDDLVRARWDRSLRSQMSGLLRWWRIFWAAGYVADARRLSKTLFIGVIAPFAGIALYLTAVAALIALAVVTLSGAAEALGASRGWGALGLLPAALAPAGWRRLDSKINLCWLSRGFLYMADLHLGRIAGQDARTDAFADRLVKAVEAREADEIIVVGHSSGALLTIGMVGRALTRRPDLGSRGPRLALVTAGQCLPGYSKIGADAVYAADLARLVEAGDIPWMDITAPSDPGSAACLHPLHYSAHQDRPGRVVRRPPRFHLAMTPEGFRRLRRDPMAFHFQYLRSSDRPEVYDWFRMIAGPGSLARDIEQARA